MGTKIGAQRDAAFVNKMVQDLRTSAPLAPEASRVVDQIVAETARGQGLGTRLLQRAEAIARARGCGNALLDTFEYQARPFYEKLGYRLFGTLDGYPPGYRQFYLTKAL